MKSQKKEVGGFTLVELIVSIAIVLMITGVAVSTFTRSREKRLVFNEAREIADLVTSTKRKVLAGEKPLACVASSIERYEVRFPSTTQVQSWAICQGNDTLVESVDLSQIEITSPAPGVTIELGVVFGGVTETTIVVCGAGYEYQIEVSAAGAVSAPEYVGGC